MTATQLARVFTELRARRDKASIFAAQAAEAAALGESGSLSFSAMFVAGLAADARAGAFAEALDLLYESTRPDG